MMNNKAGGAAKPGSWAENNFWVPCDLGPLTGGICLDESPDSRVLCNYTQVGAAAGDAVQTVLHVAGHPVTSGPGASAVHG